MNFMFGAPTTINFGAGVSKQLGKILSDGGIKRIFLVYDKGVKAAGILGGIIESLQEKGIEFLEYDGVLPNPPDYQVQEAADLAKDFKADAIVAVGGGSSMDTAKAVNVLLSNPAPINQYDGMFLVKNPLGPLFAIPTTSGTGSEVTTVSVVTDLENKKKMVIFDQKLAPTMAILDPELTYGLPAPITASTGMDALTHAMESYITVTSSPITDAINLESIRFIARSLLRAYKDGSDIEARADMLLGSMLAGMCFGNTSLGLVHAMAHPMGAYCNVPHGVANAMGLPYVMEFNAPAIPAEKMILMCQALGFNTAGKDHAALSAEMSSFLLKLSADLNIPRIRDAGVPEDLLPTLAAASMEEPGNMVNPRKATEEEMLELFKQAW